MKHSVHPAWMLLLTLAAGCSAAPGATGKSSLVNVVPEPAGSHCPTGGQAIQVGLDDNQNGALNSGEVLNTSYVCNGAAGASGPAGGAGGTAMVTTVSEPAGANCSAGGVAVRSGLDVDGDGVLDPGEVTSTAFVCNGAAGPAGPAFECTQPILNVGWSFALPDGTTGQSCSAAGVAVVDVYVNNVLLGAQLPCTDGLLSLPRTAMGLVGLRVEGRDAAGVVRYRHELSTWVGACNETTVQAQPGAGTLAMNYVLPAQASCSGGYSWFSILDVRSGSKWESMATSNPVQHPCGAPVTLTLPYGRYSLEWLQVVTSPLSPRPIPICEACVARSFDIDSPATVVIDATLTSPAHGCGGNSAATGFPQPPGTVPVNFTVDDSVNRTFGADELRWKGSMLYDSSTRKITRDAAWSGPWAPLYDDGPWTEFNATTGLPGHEPSGAVAGDHRWGVTVFATPPATGTEVYEYGLVNHALGDAWIWVGSNGNFTIPAGSVGEIVAPGMALSP